MHLLVLQALLCFPAVPSRLTPECFLIPGSPVDGRPLPGVPPVVEDMSVQIPQGSRVLLIGPNGAGKTTLLKILGGKHMVKKDSVKVLGRLPFHDTPLTSNGDLSYLGGNWERDIAFAGYSIPLQVSSVQSVLDFT